MDSAERTWLLPARVVICRPPEDPQRDAGERNSLLRHHYLVEVCFSIYTSSMALSIKSDEADRLARELAAETGETLTEAVEIALRERLSRERAKHSPSMRTQLARLAADVAALPVADDRTPEEIIGYDSQGSPR